MKNGDWIITNRGKFKIHDASIDDDGCIKIISHNIAGSSKVCLIKAIEIEEVIESYGK